MIPLKGQYRDTDPINQPEGFAYKILNAVVSKTKTYKNENGFSIHSTSYTGLSLIGHINAKYGNKILFSVKDSDGSSEIGIMDKNGVYTTKLNGNLGFNLDYPITGEVDYNYKDEIIVAFTDGHVSPKLVNLDNIPSPFSLEKIKLFPEFKEVIADSSVVDSGGQLVTGAYFPVFKYRNLDGTETQWGSIGNVLFITDDSISSGLTGCDGSAANTPSGKGIQLDLRNVDTTYDRVVLGIISKIDGILTAYEVKEIVAGTSNITTTYTGGENTKVLSLISVMSAPAIYDTVKHFTQSSGILYGASVTEKAPINFQKYSLKLKLKWRSNLLYPSSDIGDSFKNPARHSKTRGFSHNEVGAFYISYKVKGSGWTDGFIIAGPDDYNIGIGLVSELNSNLLSNDPTLSEDISISSNSRYYQTRDTTKNIVPTFKGGYGDFGVWLNQEETYPNTDDFNAATIGGEDLRGKKVRHHRFPSFEKTKQSLYNSEQNYGRLSLDILGIYIDSISLPPEITNVVEQYKILYAERTPTNSLVAGQSITLFNSYRFNSGINTDKFPTGGNWNNVEINESGTTRGDDMILDPKSLRFHSFDMLYNKPAITPRYILNNFKLRVNNLQLSNTLIVNGPNSWQYLIDYFSAQASVLPITSGERRRTIRDFKYVPFNAISGGVINTGAEEFVSATIEGAALSLSVPDHQMDFNDRSSRGLYEETYLSTMMVFRTSLYNTFSSQKLVSTNKVFLIGDSISDTIYGGDTFISEYNFNTIAAKSSVEIYNVSERWGVKTTRRFLCESINNINLRYEDETNQNSKYFPKSAISNDSAWFKDFTRELNPNQFAYNKDYTTVNNLNPILPFDTYKEFIEKDPYKIFRCAPPSESTKKISWKTFLANDYFILQKNRGVITNIKGDSEGLIINTEFSVFKTTGKEELQTDEFKVRLGNGDIFAFPPKELVYDENGYAGCQHKFSCLLTPYGYVFFDENKSAIFLLENQPKNISEGLANFIEEQKSATIDNPFKNSGYTLAWDEEFKRLIFSKIGEYTFSYSFELKSWTSEHTYKPEYLLNDRDSLFSYKLKKFYKHNIPNKFGIYYNENEIYPMEIVAIFNQEREADKHVFNIQWLTHAYLQDGSLRRDITFTDIALWNRYQGTSLIALIPFQQDKTLEENFDQCNVRRIKNVWNFNKFKNEVVNHESVFVNDFNPVPSNINVNQDFYLKKPFVDKFIVVKFLYDNRKFNNLQYEFRVDNLEISYNKV